MKVNYLQADGVRLSKSFIQIVPGTFKEESYPHVMRFSSIERNIENIKQFYDESVAAAEEGLCLLKGHLDSSLTAESRAGHTNSTELTEWICLDVDFTVSDLSPEEFLTQLDPTFKDVSFVFQFSASMGVKTHGGWRGHFFVALETPLSPQALKQWLIKLNISVPFLASRIGLSASGGALTYPLDVTTCQNDKLIYIAPPTLNFPDPVKERFILVERTHGRAKLKATASAAHNVASSLEKLVSLRTTLKLPKKTFKLTQHQGREILVNPDSVTVTGKKEEREFVYLNLNGGDSWAYYFPVSQPDVLFNFKGEPCMYMWDVDKDLYNEYSNQSVSVGDSVPFGFLWPRDDNYYRGFANPNTRELAWLFATGSKAKLKDFLVQNGVYPPKEWAVDEWDLTFDPSTEGFADFNTRTINTYKTTEFMQAPAQTGNLGIPPTIERILNSLCGTDEIKEHFINWFACIFQTRAKTNTAWIFQGVQGTGKGVLFTHIISPLIGRQYCHEMTMDRLDDNFNGYLGENIILFIDEANISDSRNGDRLLSRIKNLITEPEQHIRAMRSNAVIRNNYSNIILASNYDEIIPLEITDRRFNVAPRQESPIVLEYEDIVQIKKELPSFASYLKVYAVNRAQTRQILHTEAREKLIELSKTTVDNFFHSIRSGNLAYFSQYLDTSVKPDIDGLRYHDFALVVHRWIKTVGGPCNVSRGEMKIVYQYLQNVSMSTTKFSRMCQKYNLDMVPIRIDGVVTRGLHSLSWQLDELEIELHKEQAGTNVTNISNIMRKS